MTEPREMTAETPRAKAYGDATGGVREVARLLGRCEKVLSSGEDHVAARAWYKLTRERLKELDDAFWMLASAHEDRVAPRGKT